MSNPNESGYRHRMRVRLAVNGAKGRLMHCEKKDRSGWYWRIKLDGDGVTPGHEWAWPTTEMVIDGPGEIVSTCHECNLRFMGDKTDVLCPYCDAEAFGTTQRAMEPNHERPHVGHRRWQWEGRHRI